MVENIQQEALNIKIPEKVKAILIIVYLVHPAVDVDYHVIGNLVTKIQSGWRLTVQIENNSWSSIPLLVPKYKFCTFLDS